MGNDDRNRSLVHKITGHAAEQPFAQAKLTTASHDDDIDLSASRFGKQSGSDIVFAVINAMQDGINAVMLEMINGIGAHQRILFSDPFVSNDGDRHLLRLPQKRHALGHGAGRLAADRLTSLMGH